jgi:predicted MPP superfamily phosphohydrolase
MLPPPRMVHPDASAGIWPLDAPNPELPTELEAATGADIPEPEGVDATIARDRLGAPSHARKKRRVFFDPKSGGVRQLVRDGSHFLCRHVYHRIPLISRPYDWLMNHRLSLSEADIAIAGLPAGFAGTRVLLMSDMHAGPFVSPQALRRAMGRLQALKPDLILLAGDFTTSRVSEFSSHLEAFRQLTAPLGVFGVLGNHDHYTEEPEELCRRLEEDAGIRMLHNASVQIERGEARLWLAGVDDLNRGKPDIEAALQGTAGPVVMMSHNPDLFFAAARRGVALMVSGHTHGGQIRLPGLPVLVRQSRYRLDEGRYSHGDSELVVSRGLGAVGIPWRAACPPEGVLLTLHPK